MEEKISNLREELKNKVGEIKSYADVENLRVEYLGKKGHVVEILKNLKNVEENKRKEMGEKANILRNEIVNLIETKKEELKEKEYEEKIKNAEKIDITVPVDENVGSLHPITIVQRELEEIFTGMGFTVEDGNEIETEYNNFEAVNVPKYHPARDMQDTFWLENGELLKTQTSAAQNKIMLKYGAPLKAIFPGRCFRNEALDASHENTFFQMEGMMIDKDVSIANLIYFMKTLLSEIFKKEVEVRLRPGYFPFVEPGFAFGLGLSRLAMMKYNINDLRALNSCDLRVLKQMNIK